MTSTALAALVAAALGGLEWRRLARRRPGLTIGNALRKARHLLALVPATVVLLAAQALVVLYPEVLWHAPVWIELHHVRIVFGGLACCLSFLFSFATYGAFATRHRHRAAALPSLMIVVGIVCAVQWDFTAPIASDLRDIGHDAVVLQSSGSSCAAASAANLARRFGIARTERQMAALLGTTRFGTSPAQRTCLAGA
jgi:hypothetical protein